MCKHTNLTVNITQNHLPWNQEITATCDECGKFFELNYEDAPDGATVRDDDGNRYPELEGV